MSPCAPRAICGSPAAVSTDRLTEGARGPAGLGGAWAPGSASAGRNSGLGLGLCRVGLEPRVPSAAARRPSIGWEPPAPVGRERPCLLSLTLLINDADPTAPLLILGPSLGTHGSQWAGVAYRLADDYRVVTVDLPGHGQSPRMPDVTIEDLADEIVGIADGYGAKTFGFAGVSISGAIALTLALRAPERLRGVVALCTGPYFGGAERWEEKIGEVRAAGSLRPFVPDTADRWFAAGFLDEDDSSGPIVLEQLAQTDPEG